MPIELSLAVNRTQACHGTSDRDYQAGAICSKLIGKSDHHTEDNYHNDAGARAYIIL